jgi:hypothetical protein
MRPHQRFVNGSTVILPLGEGKRFRVAGRINSYWTMIVKRVYKLSMRPHQRFVSGK